MPMDTIVYSFSADELKPCRSDGSAKADHVNLAPGTYSKGHVLGQLSGGAVNDVQTVTIGGSPTGGTFKLVLEWPIGNSQTTATIAYDAAASAVQSAIAALSNVGAGNVAVTGSAGGPYTVTFSGKFAGQPVPVMTAGTNALTGGSSPAATIAHTTVGQTAGTYAAYSSAVVSAPSAPTVSGTGSGSAFAAGTYLVNVTAVNAQGETTPSPPSAVTLTAAQKIRVAAMSSLGSSVTSLNVYVNGTLVGSASVSSGTSTQTDFDVATVTTKQGLPATNTAYTIPNGSGCQTAKRLLAYACVVDNAGYVSRSSVSTGGLWGEKQLTAPAYYAGDFNCADLVGLDAKAVTDLGGKIANGTTSAGVLAI